MIDENNEMDEPITKDSSLDSNDEEPFWLYIKRL
jgi:hypothetical protein